MWIWYINFIFLCINVSQRMAIFCWNIYECSHIQVSCKYNLCAFYSCISKITIKLHVINNSTFIHFSAAYCWRFLLLFVTHTNSNFLYFRLSNNDDYYFFLALQSKSGLGCLNLEVPRSHTIGHTHTHIHTHTHTVGRNPLHERSARRKSRDPQHTQRKDRF